MWINPKLKQPEPQSPPEPTGRLIAASERPGRGRGPDTELRTTLDQYQGNPYLSLRVWSRGPHGQWYPTKKGVSVRIGEAEDVAAALIEGARLAHATPARLPSKPASRGPQPQRTSYLETARKVMADQAEHDQAARPPSPTRAQTEFDTEFDEFND